MTNSKNITKKADTVIDTIVSITVSVMVRAWGLEPQRRKHENLNLACLPIPSCPHTPVLNEQADYNTSNE